MLFFFVLLSVALAQRPCSTFGTPKFGDFPDIGYVGRGYDILNGLPSGWVGGHLDDGWRTPVISLTYNYNCTTADHLWGVPDQIIATADISCDFSSSSSIQTSAQEFQSSLKDSISVGEDISLSFLWKAAFTQNVNYNATTQVIQEGNRVLVQSDAVCQTYTAQIPTFSSVQLEVSSYFAAAVKVMSSFIPFNVTDAQTFWIPFFNQFGNAYSTSVNMGAKASYFYEVESSSYAKMQSNGIDIEAGASLSFLGKYGFDVSGSSHYNDYEAFQDAVKSANVYLVGVGAAPVVQQGNDTSVWTAWMKEVSALSPTATPAPIYYKLQSIDTLLTSQYFANDTQIAQKQKAVQDALNVYCGQIIPDCAPPAPPKQPPAIWGGFGYDSRHSNAIPTAITTNTPSVQWTNSLPVNEGDQGVPLASVVISSNGTIFSSGGAWSPDGTQINAENIGAWYMQNPKIYDGVIYGYDFPNNQYSGTRLDTGEQVWNVTVRGIGGCIEVSEAMQLVFILPNQGSAVFAFHISNASLFWSFPIDSSMSCPAVDDHKRLVYVEWGPSSGNQDFVSIIDMTTGKDTNLGDYFWTYTGDRPIVSSPALDVNGKLYAGGPWFFGGPGLCYGRYDSQRVYFGSPSVFHGAVYVLKLDQSNNNYAYSLWMLDGNTCDVKYSYDFPSNNGNDDPLNAPVIGSNGVILVTFDCTLWTFDSSLNPLWNLPVQSCSSLGSAVVSSSGTIFVATDQLTLFAIQ